MILSFYNKPRSQESLLRNRKNRKGNVAVWVFMMAVLLLPLAAFALYNWYATRFEKLPVYGKENHAVANFELVNQDSSTVWLRDWDKKIVIANFFFTHCPVICPKMSGNLKTVQQAFQNDPSVNIISFTVDPERDNPETLKKYGERFGINPAQWNLLTGSKVQLYQLARNSFRVVATDGDGGPQDFIHSEKLVLLDTQHRIRGYYDGTSPAAIKQLLMDIKKLKNEN
jgi:protein SCO1